MDVPSDLWDPAFRSRFNQHMHAMLATRYARLSMLAALVSALAASTSLAGSLAQWAPWIGQALNVLAALAAVVVPIMDWNGKHALHQELHAGYRSLEWRCRRGLVDKDAALAELEQLGQREDAAAPWWFERLRVKAMDVTRRELGTA